MAKKNSKKNIPTHYRDEMLKRKHRLTIQLNDTELDAIELYCKKYKIKNKSAFVREIVLKEVMTRFLDDYPTLFEKQVLDTLVVYDTLPPKENEE